MKKKSSMQMKKRMSPAKINKGLEKAAASGKLDKNPKFKAVVEKAAKKRKDDTPAMLKKSMAQLKRWCYDDEKSICYYDEKQKVNGYDEEKVSYDDEVYG